MKKIYQKKIIASLFFIILLFFAIVLSFQNEQVQAGSDALFTCGEPYCKITRTSLEKIASFTNRGVIRSMFGAEQLQHQYIPLQNGLCNITLYTGSSGSNIITSVSEAKDAFTFNDRNRQVASSTTCARGNNDNYCSFSVRIDDEYYMLHIELAGNGYVITNWNCT